MEGGRGRIVIGSDEPKSGEALGSVLVRKGLEAEGSLEDCGNSLKVTARRLSPGKEMCVQADRKTKVLSRVRARELGGYLGDGGNQEAEVSK